MATLYGPPTSKTYTTSWGITEATAAANQDALWLPAGVTPLFERIPQSVEKMNHVTTGLTRHSNFKVLIADSKPAERATTKQAVQRLRPDWGVVEAANDTEDLLRMLEQETPRLLILDAECVAGGSALDLINSLPYPMPAIVVSNNPAYAAEAYDYAVLDYVMKPLSLSRLERALLRVGQTGTAQHSSTAPRAGQQTEWLMAKRNDEIVVIPCDEIAFLQSQLKYTRVIWSGGEALIKRGLGMIEGLLDPSRFFRIHRSSIVNIRHVQGLRRDEMGRMRLQIRSRADNLVVSQAYEGLFRLPVAEPGAN